MYEHHSENGELSYAQLDHKEHSADTDLSLPGQIVIQDGDELLTIHDVARSAGVSRAAVLSWIRKGLVSAQASSDGWVIRAGDVEAARRSAEDARLGSHHNPEERMDLRASTLDSEIIVETTSAILPVGGSPRKSIRQLEDQVFAPLAGFVRDQADVIQEQAETIGWLQAELRRSKEQLESSAFQSSTQPEEAGPGELATCEFDPFSVPQQIKVEAVDKGDSKAAEAAESDDRALLYDTIENDPFSEEASHARMMIEETDRRIAAMWSDQEAQRKRHVIVQARNPEEASWLKWLISPLKRREA